MLVGLSDYPLGRRGERPLAVSMPRAAAARLANMIPGAKLTNTGLSFSFEAIPAVSAFVTVPSDLLQPAEALALDGLDEYDRCFKSRLRDYQKEMVAFLAPRAYAINADPMRSGKTPTTLAAASIIGAERVLIVCPSIAKLVWATEIAKWLGQPSLILYGRGADEARAYCLACAGTGRVEGAHCPECKAANGQSYGAKIFRDAEVLSALGAHRWIICNYDLLIPQNRRDAAGKVEQDERLRGWGDLLKGAGFDLCIADEAHILRGRSTLSNRGETRRDRLVDICDKVPRVWALTGTPIYGRVADLWSLLDFVTNGLFGRPFFQFDVRYANGRRGQYGWENDGRTNEEELKSRLDSFMLKRDRSQIMPFMPPKTRQVVRLDGGKATYTKPKKGVGASGGIHAALRATAKIKEPAVVEAVATECQEGAKVVVFTYLRDNADSIAKAFADAAQKGEHSVPLRARNFKVWSVSGDTPTEVRFKMAQAFREWTGAGVFVATINSVPVAISLKGAQSVHFADITYDPADLLQAEDRPYEVGTTGLTIVYYVVEKTVDEHVVGLVLPKMETLSSVVREQTADSFRNAFAGMDPEQMAEDIWQRMVAAA